MTIAKFIPVAVIIGILAGLSIILTGWASAVLGPGYGAVWAIFISWGMYFLAGARPSRLHKEAIGLTGGIVFGYATIWASAYYSQIFGATWGLPFTVFTAAFLIVMLELTDWFELAPAYFLSYAGYFAFVFGAFNGAGVTTPENSLAPFWVLTMAGLVFGYVSAALRKKILEKEGLYGSAQETVYDKEARV